MCIDGVAHVNTQIRFQLCARREPYKKKSFLLCFYLFIFLCKRITKEYGLKISNIFPLKCPVKMNAAVVIANPRMRRATPLSIIILKT